MTRGDLDAGKAAVRKMIDASGYGGFVTDAQCEQFAASVIEAVDAHREPAAPAAEVIAQPIIPVIAQPIIPPAPIVPAPSPWWWPFQKSQS